jgi:hypothetical protein
MNDIERFGILYSALQASESILWTCLLRKRHGYVMGKLSWEAGKWILSFYLVVSTSRRSTTRGIPLFFLTIFLPYVIHQSHSPVTIHIYPPLGDPVILPHYLPSLHIPPVPIMLWPSIYSISHISTSRGSLVILHPVTIHIYLIYCWDPIDLIFLSRKSLTASQNEAKEK